MVLMGPDGRWRIRRRIRRDKNFLVASPHRPRGNAGERGPKLSPGGDRFVSPGSVPGYDAFRGGKCKGDPDDDHGFGANDDRPGHPPELQEHRRVRCEARPVDRPRRAERVREEQAKPTRPSSPGGGSTGDASRLNRAALRRSALRFGRNTPGPVLPVGAPPSRALSAGPPPGELAPPGELGLTALGAHPGSRRPRAVNRLPSEGAHTKA